MKEANVEELMETVNTLKDENKRLKRVIKRYEQDESFYPEEGYSTFQALEKIQERMVRLRNALSRADGIVIDLNISVLVDKNGHVKVAVNPKDAGGETPE